MYKQSCTCKCTDEPQGEKKARQPKEGVGNKVAIETCMRKCIHASIQTNPKGEKKASEPTEGLGNKMGIERNMGSGQYFCLPTQKKGGGGVPEKSTKHNAATHRYELKEKPGLC